MKRDVYKFCGECLVFTLAFAILLGFVVACSDSDDKDFVGGASGDAGVIAITNKQIAGVAQKGPFVKGSSVVLKETSAAGDLKPTGKEFFATTRSDSGDFVIDDINLESQYVMLKAIGYYKRESTGENSECQIRLNALSDVIDRDHININMFTHLEYGRVLKLIEKGMPFREAKKQAHTDWLNVFDKKHLDGEFEDLDVNGSRPDDLARGLMVVLLMMKFLLIKGALWGRISLMPLPTPLHVRANCPPILKLKSFRSLWLCFVRIR